MRERAHGWVPRVVVVPRSSTRSSWRGVETNERRGGGTRTSPQKIEESTKRKLEKEEKFQKSLVRKDFFVNLRKNLERLPGSEYEKVHLKKISLLNRINHLPYLWELSIPRLSSICLNKEVVAHRSRSILTSRCSVRRVGAVWWSEARSSCRIHAYESLPSETISRVPRVRGPSQEAHQTVHVNLLSQSRSCSHSRVFIVPRVYSLYHNLQRVFRGRFFVSVKSKIRKWFDFFYIIIIFSSYQQAFNRVQCHRTIRLFSFEWINLLSSQVLRPVNVASPRQIALLETPVFSAHTQQIIVILSFLYIHIRHAQDIEVSVLDQQHCRRSCIAMVSRVVRNSERKAEVKWIECSAIEKTSRRTDA